MENKNAQLIRKYMNLMESIETKIIVEEKSTDINEDLLASAAREGKLIASELEGFLKMMKQDSKISAELVKSGIRDAEELLLALKGNRLSAALKGSLELNILKSQTTNAKLIDLASENLSRNQKFLQKYSNEIKQGQPQFEAALKKSGYSNRAITKIVEKAYLKKSSGLKTVSAKNKELANKQLVGKDRLKDKLLKKPTDSIFTNKIKNFTKTKGEELKNLLKSGKNWKKISNLFRTMKSLHRYETKNLIDESGFDCEMKDYKERLFDNTKKMRVEKNENDEEDRDEDKDQDDRDDDGSDDDDGYDYD
jgi:hypothetical protein